VEAWLHGVKKEAAFLHRLSACESIINVIGILKPDGAVVLVEYASGGTLRDYHLPEPRYLRHIYKHAHIQGPLLLNA
jgi:hypothetical protein